MRRVILDTGPLGMLAHPNPNEDFYNWFTRLLESGVKVYLPEISDYELRRSFILSNLEESINRLDALKNVIEYSPLTTEVMNLAAKYWADARKRHKKGASDEALDGDVILAAQAQSVRATVITENTKHLEDFVEVINWKEIVEL